MSRAAQQSEVPFPFCRTPGEAGFIRFTHEGGTEEPMAFWLKPGVTAESIGIVPADQEG